MLAAAVAVSLVAAPCKACQPEKAPQSHDCCHKQSPEQKSPCSWQPSDVDAVDQTKVQIQVELAVEPLSTIASTEPVQAFAPGGPAPEAPPPGVAPPLYLAHATFLI